MQTPSLILVLHKAFPVEAQRRTCLTAEEREKLSLIGKSLEPVLLQGLKIHAELASLVRAQQDELEKE